MDKDMSVAELLGDSQGTSRTRAGLQHFSIPVTARREQPEWETSSSCGQRDGEPRLGVMR